jgi:exodeoxyribonuclease V alpha subunit
MPLRYKPKIRWPEILALNGSGRMKHLTVRFAWHDNGWNGRVCKDPKNNLFCRSNYSLLSPRIQRRFKIEKEEEFSNSPVSEAVSKGYLPPCYWVINATGDESCNVADEHPFKDFDPEWNVPPLSEDIRPFTIFTWCFKLGFAEEEEEKYIPPNELKNRTEKYLRELVPGRSIVFFYANYGNPISGEEMGYLVLGAGLVKRVSPPKYFQIPEDLMKKIRRRRGMRNFSKQAWQFKIELTPESVFFLPYHDYLEWIKKCTDMKEKERMWKKLEEIALSVGREEPTLLPHFKYVSMHLNHDKAIFLLYLIRRTLLKVKEQGFVSDEKVQELERKAEKLIRIAWENRTEFPGFANFAKAELEDQYEEEELEEFLEWVEKEFEVERFVKDIDKIREESVPPKFHNALKMLQRLEKEVKFLPIFDFTKKQFKKILNEPDLNTIRENPYILLERYDTDWEDSWNQDESDYGISFYLIDIALIPDPKYSKAKARFDVKSPQRVRALIADILKKRAILDGNTYLLREEILEEIKNYPLYYINQELQIGSNYLASLESQPIFKDKFIIQSLIEEDRVLYQLRELREIESTVEEFVKHCVRGEVEVDAAVVKELVEREMNRLIEVRERLDLEERRKLYRGTLKYRLFIVLGKAGSGKTTAVTNVVGKFSENRIFPIYVFAPTGKATLVLKNRLEKWGLKEEIGRRIHVSTIHRFLYGILDRNYSDRGYREAWRLIELIDKIVDKDRWELFPEYSNLAKRFKHTPKVLIIDEFSMVDEVLLAVLLELIDVKTLEHLVLVGDEKQLPPVGVGTPLADITHYLRREGYDDRLIELTSNLRFDEGSAINKLAVTFEDDKPPLISHLDEIIKQQDGSLKVVEFSSTQELKGLIEHMLDGLGVGGSSIFDKFAKVFEEGADPDKDILKILGNLDRVQIISPHRYRGLGTNYINREIVVNGDEFVGRSKIICEANLYFYPAGRKVLGLANGSIGYIRRVGDVRFQEFFDLLAEYENDKSSVYDFINEVRENIFRPQSYERRFDFAYAITVHKAQGSDFGHVMFILPELSRYVTRELIYTALTRAKDRLYIAFQKKLGELSDLLAEIWRNSEVERRKTMLFEYKKPKKPYKYVKKNGEVIRLRSKIEREIARKLDDLGVDFEYEPMDLSNHGIYPDFKLRLESGEYYYLEHLGNMKNQAYRERNLRKIEKYKELGLKDRLITTSEAEADSCPEKGIEIIMSDIKKGKLQFTEGGYSSHHYEL